MHMADALISPAVGGAMWAATAVTAAYCAKKVREEADESKIPLMAVAGAFIFAAQMLNFSIPGTGSSGHLGGGLILAVLLGPYAAFLVMASVLGVQALFFADGGLLALGANIFNLGFFPAFIAFPFIYKLIVGDKPTTRPSADRWDPRGDRRSATRGVRSRARDHRLRHQRAAVHARSSRSCSRSTWRSASSRASSPQASIAVRLAGAAGDPRARTTRNGRSGAAAQAGAHGPRRAAVLAGAVFSWFASPDLDGLEWSIARRWPASPRSRAPPPRGPRGTLARCRRRRALLPDYAFPTSGELRRPRSPKSRGPRSMPGTSTAGIVGAASVLGVVRADRACAQEALGTGNPQPPPSAAPAASGAPLGATPPRLPRRVRSCYNRRMSKKHRTTQVYQPPHRTVFAPRPTRRPCTTSAPSAATSRPTRRSWITSTRARCAAHPAWSAACSPPSASAASTRASAPTTRRAITRSSSSS